MFRPNRIGDSQEPVDGSCKRTSFAIHGPFRPDPLSLVVPIFLGITLLAFVLIRLVPGDPIETLAGERGLDPARHGALRKEYGFDNPGLV
jgi:hypothetical protein